MDWLEWKLPFIILAIIGWIIYVIHRARKVTGILNTSGAYLTPLDFELSKSRGRAVYKESEAYSVRQDAYFRIDLRLSFRQEFKRSTLEASLDLQNLTNKKNIFAQNYNPRTNSVITLHQQPFFPVPYVRFTF